MLSYQKAQCENLLCQDVCPGSQNALLASLIDTSTLACLFALILPPPTLWGPWSQLLFLAQCLGGFRAWEVQQHWRNENINGRQMLAQGAPAPQGATPPYLGDDVPILSVHLSDGPQLSQTREDLIQLKQKWGSVTFTGTMLSVSMDRMLRSMTRAGAKGNVVGTSLVVQEVSPTLPVKRTWAPSLVREPYPTCHN